jgi:hypothetical protein
MAIEITYRDTAIIIRPDKPVVTTWEEVWTDTETGQEVVASSGEREEKPKTEGVSDASEMTKAVASIETK